jgi:hypothetical protein
LPDLDLQPSDEMNLYFPLSAAFDPSAPPTCVLLRRQATGANGICAPETFDGIEPPQA